MESQKRVNKEFIKNPNFKYKNEIINTNTSNGIHDIFEVYISYKDNNQYIVSPNYKNYYLDIYLIENNKKILSLNGHKINILSVKYFISSKNNNEYLISSDLDNIVIIWDITNNYTIIHQIDTKTDKVYACILIFPNIIDQNFFVISGYLGACNLYSLENGEKIRALESNGRSFITYLLSWYNKKDDNYYVIEFSERKIKITNILKKEDYAEINNHNEENFSYGLIYQKDKIDYLCCLSSNKINGFIYFYDLYNKRLIKVINNIKGLTTQMIQWNQKYLIIVNYLKSIKIFDLEKNKIISEIKGKHAIGIVGIKKIHHPVYGESLISAGYKKIKLWII